ncbi:MAG: DMT family transporter [Planctomycetota bacterium]
MLLAAAILIGLLAGGLLGMQPSVNGALGKSVAHPLQASLISFASGTAILLVLTIALGGFPPKFLTPPGQLPWWIWFGGSIGVVMVTTSLFWVPRVGSLPWFAAVMTGQTIVAILLDHYGLLGNPRSSVSAMRLLGAGLLIAGVLLIVAAKQLESSAEPGVDDAVEAERGAN